MASSDPSRIVLREYESIPIGERWDRDQRTISISQARAIETLQASIGRRLFAVGQRKLQASQWVGSLGIGRYCLEVIPKIDAPGNGDPERRARQNLLFMISRGRRIPVSDADMVRLADTGRPLIVAYIQLFVESLAVEWRRGAIRRYIQEEQNRQFLRGKLLFSEHLRRNLIRRDRFFTASDEFTVDNPVSRLLKAALRVCTASLLPAELVNTSRALMAEFEGVADVTLTPQEIDQTQLDRSIARFEKAFTLAKFILKEVSPSPLRNTSEKVLSLMFDMNEVFEQFITAELKHAMFGKGYSVRSQFSSRALLRRNGQPKFNLIPDIGVFRGEEAVCVVDTKWKVLDPSKSHNNVAQADMYQMYAYGKEYQCPLVVLLYPRHGVLKERIAEYEHTRLFDDRLRRIIVATTDVSSPMNSLGTIRDLREGLCRLVTEEV